MKPEKRKKKDDEMGIPHKKKLGSGASRMWGDGEVRGDRATVWLEDTGRPPTTATSFRKFRCVGGAGRRAPALLLPPPHPSTAAWTNCVVASSLGQSWDAVWWSGRGRRLWGGEVDWKVV